MEAGGFDLSLWGPSLVVTVNTNRNMESHPPFAFLWPHAFSLVTLPGTTNRNPTVWKCSLQDPRPGIVEYKQRGIF